jgi:SAM-dependent methyltransferase
MFNPKSIEEGKSDVVGNCNGLSKEERWDYETPIFAEIINKQREGVKKILDFGCGCGRVARELLDNNKDIDEIYGLDTSPEMLKIAKDYVLSDRFKPIQITEESFGVSDQFEYAYCIYVLQHIPALDLRETIKYLSRFAKKVFVVNSCIRMAVSNSGFHNDGIDVLKELGKYFSSIRWGIPIKYIIEDRVMRTMFMEGNTKHYGVLCENGK